MKLKSYLVAITCARREGWEIPDVWTLLRWYPAWRRSLLAGSNPLSDGKPWMTFGAIDFVSSALSPEMRVFEYGSGGSTLFFGHCVSKVVSVEHDKLWAEKVQAELERHGMTHCDLSAIEPATDPQAKDRSIDDPDGYISDDERYRSCSFRNYVLALERYPSGYFDWIIVDGRARPSCLRHAMRHSKVGGYILLDNSERTYYGRAAAELEGGSWLKRAFAGPVPYQRHFSKTTIWERLS